MITMEQISAFCKPGSEDTGLIFL